MQFLLFIPALLVFLYALYRLVKDDYIFIRKGISLEQSFDFAFISLFVGLLVSRSLYLFLHLHMGENFFVDYFSFKNAGLSLTGAVLGAACAVYFISKYKKLPLSRLSDFLSLSLLYSLPLIFLANALIVKSNQLLIIFLNAVIYFVLLLFFIQFLYPKVMNRTLREGMIALLFLLFYSITELVTSLLLSFKHINSLISPENIILLCAFLISVVLLVKHGRTVSHSRNVIRQ